MVTEWNNISPEQIDIYHLLESIRCLSVCQDKQVAAIATDDMGRILSIAYNVPTSKCNSCEGGEHSKDCARHAEKGLLLQKGCIVYLTTFPCKECQVYMFAAGVSQVVVFGQQHKEDTGLLDIYLVPDIAGFLVNFNGIEKQKSVIMGELAELITAIADSMRKDTKDQRDIISELLDVELQLKCLRRCLDPVYLGDAQYEKYNKLLRRLV